MDGVDGADSVAACAGQVGADAEVVAESVGGPVSGDGLVPFRVSECLFGSVVRPGDLEVVREQPELFGLVLEAPGEGVAGVIACVPVAVPVGGDAPFDGLVLASPQVGQEVGSQLVGAGGAGCVDSLGGRAQHSDDLAGPVLPARVQFQHALAVADDVAAALLNSSQMSVELVPAGVVLTHQETAPALEDIKVGDRGLGARGHRGIPDQPGVGGAQGDRVRRALYPLSGGLVEVVAQHIDGALVTAEHVFAAQRCFHRLVEPCRVQALREAFGGARRTRPTPRRRAARE